MVQDRADVGSADGGAQGTQDLYYFANLRKRGLRVACDTRVKVGHLDIDRGWSGDCVL